MKFKMKKFKIALLLIILTISLIYISDIENLPSNVVLFEGEALSLNTILGVDIETEFSSNPNIERLNNNETVTVNANAENIEDLDCTGTINLGVKLLGAKVKQINVDIIENTEVIPIGNLIGVKLYTNGVLVVGMSEISDISNNKHKPYEGTGIEEGDVIVKIDEKDIASTNELLEKIKDSKGSNMSIEYIRNRRSSKYNDERC